MSDYWSVTVMRNHEKILVIESNGMSGKTHLTPEDEKAIRLAGEHLLAFIGPEEQTPFIT